MDQILQRCVGNPAGPFTSIYVHTMSPLQVGNVCVCIHPVEFAIHTYILLVIIIHTACMWSTITYIILNFFVHFMFRDL